MKKPKIVYENGKRHLDIKESNEYIRESFKKAIKEISRKFPDLVDNFKKKHNKD